MKKPKKITLLVILFKLILYVFFKNSLHILKGSFFFCRKIKEDNNVKKEKIKTISLNFNSVSNIVSLFI